MSYSAARVVEMEATSKLEAMLSRLKGVANIYSESSNGWGNITLELDKHTSIDIARFEVSTIIRQTWPELPRGVSYPSISVDHPDKESTGPFMSYSINSSATWKEMHSHVENVIKNRLRNIPGIYNVEVNGSTPMIWELEYDNKQLELLHLTVSDIQNAIQMYYKKSFLGLAKIDPVTGSKQWIRVMFKGSVKNDFDASSISVIDKNGSPISLNRLVKTTHKEELPVSYYRINGLNSTYINLSSSETANQLELSKKVKETMDEISRAQPRDYEINLVYDKTTYIKRELTKIGSRVALTVFTLLLLVLIIKRSFKYLLLIATSLVINFSIAGIFYYLLKLEIQLYSLAAITISLSLIIDNVIMMSDHVVNKHNRKIFLPILTSAITTIGALSLIFLQDDSFVLNLVDFVSVVIINIIVSLFVVAFYVPAYLECVQLTETRSTPLRSAKILSIRRTLKFTSAYKKVIHLLNKKKKLVFLLLILVFGIPVSLIPDKIENDTIYAKAYNRAFDHELYKDEIKSVINKLLGGTLRLFIENVPNKKTSISPDNIDVLKIIASMPNGTTITQTNEIVENMERFLNEFKEIKQFRTQILGPRQANITVVFTAECLENNFQYFVKNRVIDKALIIGGGSWSIYGVDNQFFSNDIRKIAGQNGVQLSGYNYDELYAWADTLSKNLLSHRRIERVSVNARFLDFPDEYEEYAFNLKKSGLANSKMSGVDFFGSLNPFYAKNIWAGSVTIDGRNENIILRSKQSDADLWSLKQDPNLFRDRIFRVDHVSDISRQQAPQEIVKMNQQYQLMLQFDFTGSNSQAEQVLKDEVDKLNEHLPIGYTAKKYNDGRMNIVITQKYLTIILLISIMFFTTVILFNSVWQSLAIVMFVPITYIGVFLTFYLFKLNFDQGGMASLFIVTGITVNACVYIIHEANNERYKNQRVSMFNAFIKAWSFKILPISLTFISTILGFVPFIILGDHEAFWFTLAAGTIGGLIMSIIAFFWFFPLFVVRIKSRQ